MDNAARALVQAHLSQSPNGALGLVIDFLKSLFHEEKPERVIDLAIQFYFSSGPPLSGDLRSGLLRTISDEAEKVYAPASPLLKRVRATRHLAPADQLRNVASYYLELTKPLIPIVNSFAKTIPKFTALEGRQFSPHLLLRDGLIFYPSLVAQEIHPVLVAYSRKHLNAQANPEIVGSSLGQSALLIDVGLYGSLVSALLEQEIFHSPGVLFFASRSPFILGWLNTIIGTALVSGRATTNLIDVIRIADTMESLLKPLAFTRDSGGVTTTLSDPISFVSSILFLWNLHKDALQKRLVSDPLLAVRSLSEGNCPRWFVKKALPRWKEADRFIASWPHGLLFPMDRFSGFRL